MADEQTVNRKREIELNGASGAAYTISFGTNTMVRVEEAFDKPFMEVVSELRASARRGLLGDVRKFFRLTLLSHPDATLDQAGDILDDVGGPMVMSLFISGFDNARQGTTAPAPVATPVESTEPQDASTH